MRKLTPELHAVFSGLLRERLGLHYGFDDVAVLGDKLEARAQDVGFESLLDYYYHLRYDPEGERELTALGETLVVHESYLFRELAPLELVVELLARAIARGDRPRVWSAACAAGEEPLTLAMLLDDRGLLPQVGLVASDLSGRALARARAGVYSRRALRHDPAPALAARYVEVADRSVRVAPRLIAQIDWRQVNLVDDDQVAALGRFDIILCRNVLIYFDENTTGRVVRSLAGRLRPGGVLLVGIAESLLRLRTELVCEEQAGVFLYRKAAP